MPMLTGKPSKLFIVLSPILIIQGSAQNVPRLSTVSEVPHSIDLSGKRIPKWADGSLVVLEGSHTPAPRVSAFDQNGRLIGASGLTIPEAQVIAVTDFARSSDGLVVMAGSAADREGRSAFFVGWVFPGGENATIIRTGRYFISRVIAAPDGTIWTQGFEDRGQVGSRNIADLVKSDAMVFRRFDRTGKLVGSYVRQDQLEDPIALTSGVESIFAVRGTAVIWYSLRSKDFFEIMPDGTVSHTAAVVQPKNKKMEGFAITRDGDIFLASNSQSGWSICWLDLAKRSWVPVLEQSYGPPPRISLNLFGATENTLIAWTDARHFRILKVER
jgi:hypothetical protein